MAKTETATTANSSPTKVATSLTPEQEVALGIVQGILASGRSYPTRTQMKVMVAEYSDVVLSRDY
jgi:hypothetical protein